MNEMAIAAAGVATTMAIAAFFGFFIGVGLATGLLVVEWITIKFKEFR